MNYAEKHIAPLSPNKKLQTIPQKYAKASLYFYRNKNTHLCEIVIIQFFVWQLHFSIIINLLQYHLCKIAHINLIIADIFLEFNSFFIIALIKNFNRVTIK